MALVAPSILSADFLHLADDVRAMEEAGAQMLHVDVMDGHFVPNLSIGIPVIKELRRNTDLLLDVHLMISNPDEMAEQYIEAGADYLSVHYEVANHLDRLMEGIREDGVRPGVVLNPHTPVSVLEEILPKCDYVLIMSVNPGFGGQKFIATSFEKVRKLKALIISTIQNTDRTVVMSLFSMNISTRISANHAAINAAANLPCPSPTLRMRRQSTKLSSQFMRARCNSPPAMTASIQS